MTKNELIEAINATIVPNGQKAITAESLANLLMEMVNATPEGGNGGDASNSDLKVCVSQSLGGELTPEMIEENSITFDALFQDPTRRVTVNVITDGIHYAYIPFAVMTNQEYDVVVISVDLVDERFMILLNRDGTLTIEFA